MCLALVLFGLFLKLVGGLFVSLFHTKQADLKPMTSYSSVAYVSLITGGIITQGY
jgi:NADH:ubiquinone oxidoreductase subunit 4 (subunit M)